jgi:predicted MPP superfamily phosphohydrolase
MSCLFCHVGGSGEFTENHQVHFLRDSTEVVHLPQGPIWISGIEKEEADPSPPLKILQFLKNKKPVIILSHNPLSFDLLVKDHDIFMLAGDTHGGQVPLPSWFSGIIGYEKCIL